MKAIAIGVLLAVTLVSVAGCHWRHRRWRDHNDRNHYSQYNGDRHGGLSGDAGKAMLNGLGSRLNVQS